LGYLKTGIVDDGNGSSRSSIFNYSHEKNSGRTSSVSQQTIKINNKKIILINDSYNSNPMSLNEAIDNFSLRKKDNQRKVLIMGDMLELGKRSKYYHQQAAKILNKTNIDKVYCIGSEVRHTYQKLNLSKRGMLVKNISFLKENIFNLLQNNDILLVKSSNRIGLFNFFKKF
jgi:UDP-N-acetylmuramyl pentapeptide synthase